MTVAKKFDYASRIPPEELDLMRRMAGAIFAGKDALPIDRAEQAGAMIVVDDDGNRTIVVPYPEYTRTYAAAIIEALAEDAPAPK